MSKKEPEAPSPSAAEVVALAKKVAVLEKKIDLVHKTALGK